MDLLVSLFNNVFGFTLIHARKFTALVVFILSCTVLLRISNKYKDKIEEELERNWQTEIDFFEKHPEADYCIIENLTLQHILDKQRMQYICITVIVFILTLF